MKGDPAPLGHPALEEGGDSASELTDLKRIGVLLQGASLLAHLERVGGCLAAGWDGARIDGNGLLRGVRAVRGARPRAPQVELRCLLESLFSAAGPPLGKGRGRRTARILHELWAHDFPPVGADRATEQVLEEAAFLWEEGGGGARRALVAEDLRGDGGRLLVAGPPAFRRRVRQASGADPERAEELVAGPPCRELWWGDRRGDAVATAERLYDAGRFRAVLQALHRRRSRRAALLRCWAQTRLGEWRAARRGLEALAESPLSAAETLELAGAAVRIYASLGRPAGALSWIARARNRAQGPGELRVALLEAESAWDRKDRPAMAEALARVEGSERTEGPELAWRIFHARGLAAMADGDGEGLVREVSQALAVGRRHLRRFEAGALWNDLAVGRVWIGDLPGAERACRHVVRLLGRCEGRRYSVLGLTNLAEVRLRRGRPETVREILASSLRANRESGNVRGEIQDLELGVRLELVRGRPRAALSRAREALERSQDEGGWRSAELELLAARALGWLERPEEAEEALARSLPEALAELDPEERPAVWALAGRREEALAAARGTPFESLWRGALLGEDPPFGEWASLEHLERYPAARLILDLELVDPGFVPEAPLHAAAEAMRRVGAELLAEKLAVRSRGPWSLLAEHLEGEPGSPDALARLFAAADRPEVRLVRVDASGREELLLAGAGGAELLGAPLGDGRLQLRAPVVDDVVRGLFALARRELGAVRRGRDRGVSKAPTSRLVGEDPTFLQAVERALRLAPSELPVLVLGESGTGKELVARAIHDASRRAAGPFLPYNCAALAESLLLSELFGHVRGAFTGAERDRVGLFEAARGGTVFLDEIGDLPAAAQGSFLRVLQEREIRRVGESLPRRVDVRIVAATHRDLEARVEDGTFRQDLYYRLKVGRVLLPPLRERGGDVLLLAETTLRRVAPGSRLDKGAREALRRHPWPGNVRELANVLEAAAALAEGSVVRREQLDLPAAEERPPSLYAEVVDDARRRVVREALEATDWRMAEAARRLGISRQSLSYLVRRLGLYRK